MSTILEALRRSEAERDRAQGARALPPAPEAARRRWGPPLAGLVLLLLAAGVAWERWAGGEGRAPSGPAQTAPSAPGTTGPPPAPPVADRRAQRARAADPAPGAPRRGDGEPAPEPGRRGSLSTTLPTALDDREPDRPAPRAETESQPPAPSEPARANAAGAARQAPEADSRDLPTASPQRPAQARPPPSAEALPSAYAMPPGEARSLVESLALSMHVYRERPEARFVLVDLRRRSEGAALGAGVTIARITPDGVVLETRDGRRWFWAPR